jgi:hypothetical protein
VERSPFPDNLLACGSWNFGKRGGFFIVQGHAGTGMSIWLSAGLLSFTVNRGLRLSERIKTASDKGS